MNDKETRLSNYREFTKIYKDVKDALEHNRMKSVQCFQSHAYGYWCIKCSVGSKQMLEKVKNYLANNFQEDICYLEETFTIVKFITNLEYSR